MPTFFSFEQGTESRSRLPTTDTSPLLGRFRAVPRAATPLARDASGLGGGGGGLGGRRPTGRRGSLGLLTRASWRNSVHVGHGYGALLAAELEDDNGRGRNGRGGIGGSSGDNNNNNYDDDEDDLFVDETEAAWVRWLRRRVWRRVDELWINPRQAAVRRVAGVWWSRWLVLVVLPAALAVGWCAVPFPQYPLGGEDDEAGAGGGRGDGAGRHKTPGHGEAKVEVNFWFFLFVYYAFYNLTALIWITKVFNLYSLNWWPSALGFPLTICLIATLGTAGPAALYFVPEARFLTIHNTVWITWTFCIMAIPVMIASCILLTKERHLGLRHSLSETQRIFTSSWWASEDDLRALHGAHAGRRRGGAAAAADHLLWDDAQHGGGALLASSDMVQHNGSSGGNGQQPPARARLPVGLRRRFLPASFVRFVWFCTALSIGLLAYVIGEAYAEVYLRTLPHSSLDTIVYVYGWISTVYLLDGLTGWILGGNQGERVGSYPLSWVFKLYFMLTYQTYVRALYARLRSPQQFILLQVLSSSSLIILTPILLSAPFHWLLTVLGMNGQSYAAYQKVGVRNVFIRFVAENASMLCFLGSVVVLHLGANKDVYPYFSFDEDPARTGDPYDYTFELTFYASAVTWACELVASCVVAGLIRWIYGIDVVEEGSLDLAVWPELLPTSVVVVLHVLQNMLFSIVRLQFR